MVQRRSTIIVLLCFSFHPFWNCYRLADPRECRRARAHQIECKVQLECAKLHNALTDCAPNKFDVPEYSTWSCLSIRWSLSRMSLFLLILSIQNVWIWYRAAKLYYSACVSSYFSIHNISFCDVQFLFLCCCPSFLLLIDINISATLAAYIRRYISCNRICDGIRRIKKKRKRLNKTLVIIAYAH